MVRVEDGANDLKLTIDPEDPRAMLELIKDIVALANSGGGTLEIGSSETNNPGIDATLVSELDSAKIMSKVNRYIAPEKVSIGHRVAKLETGKYLVYLTVGSRGKYPYVFGKDGQYKKNGQTRNVFREGDIYVRRGSQSIRASYSDIVKIIDEAEERGRQSFVEQLHEAMKNLARLPEGSMPIILATSPTGDMMGAPAAMVDLVFYRRRTGDSSAILSPQELLTVFVLRDQLDLTPERREVLIRSALRRNATLYYWLLGVEDRKFVERILLDTLNDSDRDKSDANKTILELGALYASDKVLKEIVATMSKSEYAHFRQAAANWRGRSDELARFKKLAHSVVIGGIPGADLDNDVLLQHAGVLAQRILKQDRRKANSDLIRNIGRLLLYREIQSRRKL
jgi:Predicted transcriptional regulator containing an HTH domain and an uncharacterized domain shared with the mammalian protein Schlafen